MPAALIVAGVSAVGGIANAAISSGAAHSAAKTAAQTADKNNALALQMRQENQANFQPYLDRGNAAGTNYNALLGLGSANDNAAAKSAYNTFLGSDGYQFRLNEGLKAANTGYAARGLLQSGAAMKGINNYAQGAASDEFQRYLGNLNNQQGLGYGAANAIAGNNNNYTANVTNNNNNASTAQSNATLAGANAWNGAINNAVNAFGAYQGMGSSYGSGGIKRNSMGVVGGDGSGIY